MGLSVGGQDVVYVKQDHSSSLSPRELRQHLDRLGDELFTGTCALPPFHWRSKEHKLKVCFSGSLGTIDYTTLMILVLFNRFQRPSMSLIYRSKMSRGLLLSSAKM